MEYSNHVREASLKKEGGDSPCVPAALQKMRSPLGHTAAVAGNQMALQLAGEGTYADKERERQRLSSKYNSNVSGTNFEFEHVLGFSAMNPRNFQRASVRHYEGIQFAYAEIRLAHRLHIGTGKGTKNHMYKMLRKIQRSNDENWFDARMEEFSNHWLEYAKQLTPECKALVLPIVAECRNCEVSETDRRYESSIQEVFIKHMDELMLYIEKSTEICLSCVSGVLQDFLQYQDIRDVYREYVLQEVTNVLYNCIREELGMAPVTDFASVSPIKERGFESDEVYRRDQAAAIYEKGQVGDAVQLNQLGYAAIYDYYRRHGYMKPEMVLITNDSFLHMVECMNQIEAMEAERKIQKPNEDVPSDDKSYRIIQVTAEERCEMILARIAMLHGVYPDVCAEVLVRFYIMEKPGDEGIREAVLELMYRGSIGDKFRTAVDQAEFLAYFQGKSFYADSIGILAQFGISDDEKAFQTVIHNLPNMSVTSMLVVMGQLVSAMNMNQMEDWKRELFSDMCASEFLCTDDLQINLLFGNVQLNQTTFDVLLSIIMNAPSPGNVHDKRLWFRNRIYPFGYLDCMEMVLLAREMGFLWQELINHMMLLPESDNFLNLVSLFRVILTSSDLSLLSEASSVVWRLSGMLSKEALDVQIKFINDAAELLNGLPGPMEDSFEMKGLFAQLLALLTKQPETGEDVDYGLLTLCKFSKCSQEEGADILSGFKSDDPEVLLQSIGLFVESPNCLMLPYYLERVENPNMLVLVLDMLYNQGCDNISLVKEILLRITQLGEHEEIDPFLFTKMLEKLILVDFIQEEKWYIYLVTCAVSQARIAENAVYSQQIYEFFRNLFDGAELPKPVQQQLAYFEKSVKDDWDSYNE